MQEKSLIFPKRIAICLGRSLHGGFIAGADLGVVRVVRSNTLN